MTSVLRYYSEVIFSWLGIFTQKQVNQNNVLIFCLPGNITLTVCGGLFRLLCNQNRPAGSRITFDGQQLILRIKIVRQ